MSGHMESTTIPTNILPISPPIVPTILIHERSIVKTIHFIRHGQATSNAAAEILGRSAYESDEYLDALLTPLGETQCKELREIMKSSSLYSNVDLIVVSPLRRALQTATIALDGYINRLPWIALESLRETSGAHPCDRRIHRNTLAETFPHISFHEITSDEDPLYPQFSLEREPVEHVVQRARLFLTWLSQRKEKEIVLVGHSSYTDYLFAYVFGLAPETCKRLGNCEARTFIVCLDQFAKK